MVDRRGQQNARFVALMSLAMRFKASFSPISTVPWCLQTAQMPRCRDLAIFVPGQTTCEPP